MISSLRTAAIWLGLTLGPGSTAIAAAPAEPPKTGEPSVDEKARSERKGKGRRKKKSGIQSRALANEPAEDVRKRYYQVREATRRQLRGGQGTIHIYQIIEEMVDDTIDDLRKVQPEVVSPLALRAVSVSRNLHRSLGDLLETTLLSAIAGSTELLVKRCLACRALRSRIEDDDWVVTLGLTEQESLRREAQRLAVKTFLDVRFAFFPQANIVVLQVEILGAQDGAVLWAETYRSDATTASILRSGDRVLSRQERTLELERKLEARPHYGHIIWAGASHIPYDSPEGGMGGAALGYRLYEKFGEERRWLFGIGAELFAKLGKSALLGSFIGATLQYELLEPNLNQVTVRTGPAVNGFFAGEKGNSVAVEWGLDLTLQFRLGAGVSVMYFRPVKFAEYDLGGFGGKARATFNW